RSRVWEGLTGRLLKTCRAEGSQAEAFVRSRRERPDRLMNSIGLTRDGTTLATCASSINGEFTDPVRIWDPQTGELRREFAAENIHGRPMALSPDGSVLATGG